MKSKIKFGLLEKNTNLPIVNFLINNNFELIEINDLKKTKEKIIVVVTQNIKKEKMIDKINYLRKNNTNSIYYFLPSFLKNENLIPDEKSIFYPITILSFKKRINDLFLSSAIKHSDLSIESDNFLINVMNNEKIYLTEKEASILKLLFKNKTIKREKIKAEVLLIKSTIETKSLDSHLSRIRKKIFQIKSITQIVSSDNNLITII